MEIKEKPDLFQSEVGYYLWLKNKVLVNSKINQTGVIVCQEKILLQIDKILMVNRQIKFYVLKFGVCVHTLNLNDLNLICLLIIKIESIL